ncbi:peptidase C39-like protein [Roseivirga pacifica]|uniref:Peptidase_C39 like family protein n=1 Tax=Roseivirga pacifica TaxID=1267423 RepID=A0A1I0MNA4_9BACT|nr:C39 family peptidase [Roseivirga pacifica]RKQ50503.1 peptidase C39-like protein [Roseivirga pacifica]SEV89160.1 Peptidase_C39 like family protein [Roseivirga pacifica]
MLVSDKVTLDINMLAQPNDFTCGPTCLQAVYEYYNDGIQLNEVIAKVKQLKSGGTLAVNLANHALKRGYEATIYTYNLQIFDPSWFEDPDTDLVNKLAMQCHYKPQRKIRFASTAYQKFLRLGGKIKFQDLTPDLLKQHLLSHQPILTGLSATYLYGSPREIGDFKVEYDDLRGAPVGHFVVLDGISLDESTVSIADPLKNNPTGEGHHYEVDIHRLINSIMLGMVTYDANLLVIKPKQ